MRKRSAPTRSACSFLIRLVLHGGGGWTPHQEEFQRVFGSSSTRCRARS
jgi:hypothetical protein